MATIELYASKVNSMPSLIKDVKSSVSSLKSEILNMKTKTMWVDSSICDLDEVVNTVVAATKVQEDKVAALEVFEKNSEQFIEDTARIDADVAELVDQRKDDFYDKYYYLKPECEKSGWEKFCDGCKKVGEWCKENWKTIVKIVVAVVIIVALGVASVFTCGTLAVILAGAFWGALIGGVLGGVMGGITSAISGGSFLEGFADGLLSGTITGAITGAATAGLGVAGQAVGKGISCMSKLGKAIKITSKVTAVLSAGMDGFDMLAMGIGLFNPDSALVKLNQKLHSSTLYNAAQFTINGLAIFTGAASSTMKCFVAGTLILTAAGYVAIETVKAGDKVISTNADTFEVAEKTVLETYVRETTEVIHLTVNGEVITSTADHPFYVQDVGFVGAGDLYIGDKLLDAEGNTLVLEDIKTETLTEPVKVFNFKVDEFHTYHVGENNILVHNTCRKPTSGGVENPDGTTTYTKTIDGKEISVTYNQQGYPDFSPYSKTLPNGQKSVNIEYSGSRQKDFRLADKAAGFTKDNPRPQGWTWHHHEDMSTMQLVPSNIQNASQGGFAHSGGVELWQIEKGIKYRP